MDGYSVARTLRRHPDLGKAPIVVVTPHAMIGDRGKALEAGCTAYVEKPINPETFVEEIRRHLRPRSPSPP
jgi:CheY-like chemotaxis protein